MSMKLIKIIKANQNQSECHTTKVKKILKEH